jgi:phage I-like protein
MASNTGITMGLSPGAASMLRRGVERRELQDLLDSIERHSEEAVAAAQGLVQAALAFTTEIIEEAAAHRDELPETSAKLFDAFHEAWRQMMSSGKNPAADSKLFSQMATLDNDPAIVALLGKIMERNGLESGDSSGLSFLSPSVR